MQNGSYEIVVDVIYFNGSKVTCMLLVILYLDVSSFTPCATVLSYTEFILLGLRFA